MNYIDIYDEWLNVDLRKRIAIAVITAAVNVLNEDISTPNHAERKDWAKNTLSDPLQAALDMSSGVVLNPTIQSGSYTDSDLQWVVNGLIDVYAV